MSDIYELIRKHEEDKLKHALEKAKYENQQQTIKLGLEVLTLQVQSITMAAIVGGLNEVD